MVKYATFECGECGRVLHGYLHANGEVLDENDETVGYAPAGDDDEITPALCMECGCYSVDRAGRIPELYYTVLYEY
jgi:hypothetical protein